MGTKFVERGQTRIVESLVSTRSNGQTNKQRNRKKGENNFDSLAACCGVVVVGAPTRAVHQTQQQPCSLSLSLFFYSTQQQQQQPHSLLLLSPFGLPVCCPSWATHRERERERRENRRRTRCRLSLSLLLRLWGPSLSCCCSLSISFFLFFSSFYLVT